MHPILSVKVLELHIDLLFLEEFYASSNFRNWFISMTTGETSNIQNLASAKHRVVERGRESDLEIAFHSPEGEIRFLIENKIDAQFQLNQAADYKERALSYERLGKCIKSYTVLTAPQNYINRIKDIHIFDYYLSFEYAIEYFKSQSIMGDRAKYKIDVLQRAIEKYESMFKITDSSTINFYQPSEINDELSLFWKKYYEDIKVRHPDVDMPYPKEKGPGATFISLANMSLPSNVIIRHKFMLGFVDLQFDSLGTKAESFIQTFKDHLEEGMSIQRKGKKAVVVQINVPKINPYLNYEDIQVHVYEAQDSAKKLLTWFSGQYNRWQTFNSVK